MEHLVGGYLNPTIRSFYFHKTPLYPGYCLTANLALEVISRKKLEILLVDHCEINRNFQ